MKLKTHKLPIDTFPARNLHGFALVATVSMMILLIIIALGLITLSTSESKTTHQERSLQEARANARMALMIAIGELQKAMGPDQRVSANARIMSVDDAGNKASNNDFDATYIDMYLMSAL